MSRRKSFIKRSGGSEEMTLQITSMADIFTIILVFLLKGYATGAVSITPSQGMLLPEAQASSSSVEAMKVEISEKGVQIEGQPASALTQFAFAGAEINSNGTSKVLSAAFEKERKRQLMIAQSNTDVKIDPKIIVIADQRAPYSTIKTVLASAAIHGYTDFKLAVIQGE